jgi:hypothetical protein
MTKTAERWLRRLQPHHLLSGGLGAAAVFLLMPAFVIVAATLDDPTVTSVSLDSISKTTAGATDVTLTVSFVTEEAIPAQTGFYLAAEATDCYLPSWQDCQYDFEELTSDDVSGVAGTLDESSWDSTMYWRNSSELAAGTHTVTISGVTNPNYHGGQRLFVWTPASEVSGGDRYATKSAPFTLGKILVKGVVTDNGGNPVRTYGQVHDKNWTVNNGFNTDEWGFYAVRSQGFASGSEVELSVYPDTATTGLATTSVNFTYSGTTVSKNITPKTASKTLTGTITYENGKPVTSASLFGNNPNGGWASAEPNSQGAYTMKLTGGEYQVCLGDRWVDGKMVDKDWYAKWEDSCKTVTFADNNTIESQSLNFVVKKADAKIKGKFRNPDGSAPDNGGWVSFWKDDLWFGGNVSQDDGSFSVAVVGGNTNTVSATTFASTAVASTTYNVQYQPHSPDEKTYWETKSVTATAGTTTDLGTITLAERDIAFNATVVDLDGNPVEGIYVDGWSEQGGWTNAVTDESGQATLYLFPGTWNIRPSTWNTPNYVYADPEHRQTFADGDSVDKTFVVKETSVQVTMNARDAQGNIVEVNGWAGCWSNFGGFGGELRYGTASFGAVSGEYNCHIWTPQNSEYQSPGEQSVTFVDGQNRTLDFTMGTRSATLNVNVKDQQNNLVENEQAWINAWSEAGGWSDTQLGADGRAQLRLAPGTYHVGLWFPQGSKYLSSWSHEKGVAIGDNEVKAKTITVHKITGSLRAKLLDSNGDPVANAWVGCGNYREMENSVKGDFESGRLIESGAMSGADGTAVVGLVGNHVYDCWVGAPPESGMIAPQSQTVDLTEEDHIAAKFRFTTANATIKGSVSIDQSDDDGMSGESVSGIDDLWCNAWAEEGYNTHGGSKGGSYSLAAIEGTWHVWCDGFVNNDDGSRDWYHAEEDRRVKVDGAGEFGGNDLTLVKSVFDIPESISETFDATQLKTIILDENTTLTVPANALATEGNVTITAEPEVHPVHTFADKPFGIPWNFEAYDSNGVLISGNFNQNLSITISYEDEILEDFGIEENNVLPKHWDDDAGAWKNVPNALQDTENNTITFSVEHFSQFGLTSGTQTAEAQDKKPAPKNVHIKPGTRTAHGFTVAWKKRDAARKYRVQVLDASGDVVKGYTVKRTKRQKAVTGLRSNVAYGVRVAQVVGGNAQKFSRFARTSTLPAAPRNVAIDRAQVSAGNPATVEFHFAQTGKRKNLKAKLMLVTPSGEAVPFSLNGKPEKLEHGTKIAAKRKVQRGTLTIAPEYTGQVLTLKVKAVSTTRPAKTNHSKVATLDLVL